MQKNNLKLGRHRLGCIAKKTNIPSLTVSPSPRVLHSLSSLSQMLRGFITYTQMIFALIN